MTLQIIVCVKAVPDPAQAGRIRIDPATRTLTRADVPLAFNPLDRNALEAALQIKEKSGARITVLSMGPSGAESIVRECLSLGADHGILLSDRAFAGADAYATSFTLARGIENIGKYDLILCGMASSDGATEWVGPQIASFLGIPAATQVEELTQADSQTLIVRSGMENGYRLMEIKLPALLTATRKLNRPRALSFSGIIKARKKQIVQWGLQDLGLAEDQVGQAASPTVVSAMTTRTARRQVEFIEGSIEEKAEILVQRLAQAGLI